LNLVDLGEKIEECRLAYDQLDYSADIQLDIDLANSLKRALENIDKKTEFTVYPFSIQFQTKDGLRADLPSSSLWLGKHFWELSAELDKYKNILDKVKEKLFEKGLNKSKLDPFLKQLPNERYGIMDGDVAEKFKLSVDEVIIDETDKALFEKFLTDKSWWFQPARRSEAPSGKTLDRGDVYESSLALACRVIVANSAKLIAVIKAFKESKDLRDKFDASNVKKFSFKEKQVIEPKFEASNTIYYGAPGVGKSFCIDQKCNDENSIRTIFHPDTQNSDFVGCLKPKMNGTDVIYEFRAGPFTKAIVKAYNNHDKHIYLVIEEINRASSAAVFGEIFQLLDRNAAGRSVYPIDLADPDMLEYIESKAPEAITNGQLRIPSNLSLFATMNSSDQAVMPMDTAFKRRWVFEYIPIDFSSCPMGSLSIPIRDNGEIKVNWSDFAKSINNALIDNSIPEDRLLGPWFLSPAELKTSELAQQALKGKVCLYLWDDVLRHGHSTVIFDVGIKNYGQLNTSFKRNNPIFNERIEHELLNVAITQVDEVIEE